MHQGAVEYSMFIVVSGTADVYVSDAKTEDPLQGCMMMFWDVTGKKGGALKGNDMKRPQVLVNLENWSDMKGSKWFHSKIKTDIPLAHKDSNV